MNVKIKLQYNFWVVDCGGTLSTTKPYLHGPSLSFLWLDNDSSGLIDILQSSDFHALMHGEQTKT